MSNSAAIRAEGGSVYDVLGVDTIRLVVDGFYKRMLSDPGLRVFFEGYDMIQLRAKQFKFVSFVFGDPDLANEVDMRAVHLPMIVNKGLNVAHFDKAVGYFVEAMVDAGATDEAIKRVKSRIMSMQDKFGPPSEEETVKYARGPAEQTVFEKLGDATIKAMVDLAHHKIVVHPELAKFFLGVDMKVLRRKQGAFLCAAFGGPAWTGKDMRAIHMPMVRDRGLTAHHFDVFAQQLDITMKDLRIPQGCARQVMEVMAQFRPSFLPLSEAEGANDVAAVVIDDDSKPLYERLGGEGFTTEFADRMYKKLTEDSRVNYFFAGIDVNRLKGKVSNMMAMLFTGAEYPGGFSLLRAKHTNLIKYKGLNMEHFEIYKAHYSAALREMNASTTSVKEAEAILEPFRQLFRPMGENELKAVLNSHTSEMQASKVIDIDLTTRHFCTTC